MTDWIRSLIASGTFTAILIAALYFGRDLLKTYLTRGVEHKFNTELEAVRGQLRESEERLKADLRSKEAELDALRSGAMTAMASRQVAVDKRRLEAVDQLWSAVVSLAQTKPIATLLAVVDFAQAAKRAEREPKLREFFKAMPAGGFDFKKLDLSGAQKARPFLTPLAWATYSALAGIATHCVLKLEILKGGISPEGLINDDAANQVIKAALPHSADFVDKYGSKGYHFVLDQLENKLLQDVQAMLAGVEGDKAAVEQAAEIVRLAHELTKQDVRATPGLP